MKLRQFTLTNKDALLQDAGYWKETLQNLLTLYTHTHVENEDSKEMKAVTAGSIAGMCLSMYEHFSHCVDSLDHQDTEAVIQAGLKSYDLGERHTERMERLAVKKSS